MAEEWQTLGGLVLPRRMNGAHRSRPQAPPRRGPRDGLDPLLAADGRAGPWSADASVLALLEARLAELELQLEEQGWLRLGELGGREFSRDALDRLTELARAAYLKNPLIRRAVEVGALYVWGQDLSVQARDAAVQQVIDRFWRENRQTLTGQQASRLLEIELQVTGNVFLVLFPDRLTGRVRVRQVPVEEIRQIVTNPEDRTDVWMYRREWTETPVDGGPPRTMVAYYPDWRFRPDRRPPQAGPIEVRWESPMLHIKTGAFPHWLWGVPEVYAALDWARAYKELLEDDATRSRALTRFVWSLSTRGGAPAVAAARARLGSTLGTGGAGGGGMGERNPPPVAGSVFIAGEGVELQPLRVAGATLPPDHSRPAKLMAAAALGLPETFFGDVDVGNLATARTLDRPTELRFSERRQLWRDVLSDLVQWVIDRDQEAPRGILAGRVLDEEERQVELSWPDLLERSVTERVQAVVDAATLRGQAPAGTLPAETVSRLLLVALGVEDVDGELAKLERQLQAAPPASAASAATAAAVAGAPAERPASSSPRSPLEARGPSANRADQAPQMEQARPGAFGEAQELAAFAEEFLAAVRELREVLRAGAR